MHLKELSPLRRRHFSEHGVWLPVCSRSRTPRHIEDFQQLLFFEIELKLRVVGDLEIFWQSQPHRLFGEPVDQESIGTLSATTR